MKIIQRFVVFWYHFIIGDDWRVALSVIVGLGVTTFMAHDTHITIWWLLPITVTAVLTLSLILAARRR